jgi:CpeS-like protein
MNVREFFELSAGTWFSQKTSQHLTLKQSEHGKSDLTIEILPTDNPQLVQICQQVGVDLGSIGGGIKYTWKGTMSGDIQPPTATTQQGESIAIVVADTPDTNTGKLYHAQISATPFAKGATLTPQVARYTLGDDDALTLVTTDGDTCAEERVWFESNNVRLRTTIVTQPNGESLAAFYSEIRMGG